MDNLLEYVLKSNALLTVFFLAYTLLLRKETFFRSNRWFLLFGLLSAVLLPLVTFTKVIWVEPSREITSWTQVGESIPPTVEPIAVDWLLILSCLYGIG
ncbi:MAG: peptidase M56, partial [Bacteroidota bacterium]